VGATRDRQGPIPSGHTKGLAQRLARLGALIGATECGAEIGQRPGKLQPRGGAAEGGDGLVQQLDAALTALNDALCAHGDAPHPRGAPVLGSLPVSLGQEACPLRAASDPDC
jgi:hypothetical protein